jgi:hypothetical protein
VFHPTHLAASDQIAWTRLAPRAELTIVKLDPGGEEVARYDGLVLTPFRDDGWLVAAAAWTMEPISLDGLEFLTGDRLREWFSPRYPFNAFAVSAPEGRLRGWYGNVTHPARLDTATTPPTLFWHDLYLDLVGLPDGRCTLRDEDELASSGLAKRDPGLYQTIVQAGRELVRRFSEGLPPFALEPFEAACGGAENRRQS